MNYTFTTDEANVLLESLDTALRQLGLAGLYSIVELTQIVKNTDEDAESHTYELDQRQVDAFKQVLDITAKVVGLKGAAKLVSVLNILETPQTEAAEEPTAG